MAWTTARILQKLSSHRVQRQSSTATPEGSSGKRLGTIGSLESESGTKLSTEGFPSTSKGPYMERLFSKWLQDRSSIHDTWQRFFKDLLENTATPKSSNSPSGKSESNVKLPPPGQAETLPQPPKLGSVLPAKGLSKNSKHMTRSMSHEKTPREPDKAVKDNLNASLRKIRRAPKYGLLYKFDKHRRQGRKHKSLRRTYRIPGSKGGSERRSKSGSRRNHKYATLNFKNYYEEQLLNREKAKPSKLRKDAVKDISKENKLITKPETTNLQESPQPSQQQPEDKDTLNYSEGVKKPGDNDSSPKPKTYTYKSLDELIDDLDNATIHMGWPDPIHQESSKKIQLWNDGEASSLGKMPSEKISLTDSESVLKDHLKMSFKNENKVLIEQDKAKIDISNAKPTKGAKNLSRNPTGTLPAPLGDASE